jgi:hypothetical protein
MLHDMARTTEWFLEKFFDSNHITLVEGSGKCVVVLLVSRLNLGFPFTVFCSPHIIRSILSESDRV